MADLNVHLDFRITSRTLRWGLLILLFSGLVTQLSSDSVTLSTYYPAPSGVYTQMLTTGATWLARDGGAVGIGTSAPANKLDVNGNADVRGGLGVGVSSAPAAGIVALGNGGYSAGSGCAPEGLISYDYGNHYPLYCDNTGQWRALSSTYQGAFETASHGSSCQSPNPLTGACSCPPGKTARAVWASDSSGTTCQTGMGTTWPTSPCANQLWLCR